MVAWEMRVLSLFRVWAGLGEFDDLDLDVPNVAIFEFPPHNNLPVFTLEKSRDRGREPVIVAYSYGFMVRGIYNIQ
jgi:hypothetical protein